MGQQHAAGLGQGSSKVISTVVTCGKLVPEGHGKGCTQSLGSGTQWSTRRTLYQLPQPMQVVMSHTTGSCRSLKSFGSAAMHGFCPSPDQRAYWVTGRGLHAVERGRGAFALSESRISHSTRLLCQVVRGSRNPKAVGDSSLSCQLFNKAVPKTFSDQELLPPPCKTFLAITPSKPGILCGYTAKSGAHARQVRASWLLHGGKLDLEAQW